MILDEMSLSICCKFNFCINIFLIEVNLEEVKLNINLDQNITIGNKLFISNLELSNHRKQYKCRIS